MSKTPQSAVGPKPAPSRIRQVLGLASVGFLVAFHVLLLWERLVESTLFEPVPAIRWLATLALMLGVYRLHRNGVSLLRGRGALVLWLLVLLLHASFWGPLADPGVTADGWTGSGLLLALPALTIVLGRLASVIQRLLARLFGQSDLQSLTPIDWQAGRQSFTVRAGFLPSLACRPPPTA